MAESKLNDIWGIIKKSNFIIDNEQTNKDYFCIICKKLLTNAHSGPCGCRYCFECVNEFTKESEKYCPGETDDCLEEMLNINRNVQFEQSIDKKISKLIVKCPGKECQSMSELRNIENHTRVCNSCQIDCPYFNIGCKKHDIIQKEIENHILSDITSHSNFLSEWIGNFKSEIELLKNNLSELNNENKSLKSEIESIRSDRKTDEIICELKKKEKMYNEEIVMLKNENKSLHDDLENMKTEERNTKMSISIRTKKIKSKQQIVVGNVVNKIELEMIENKQKENVINKSNELCNENLDFVSKLNLFEEIIDNSNISRKSKLEIKRLECEDEINLKVFAESQWKIENFSKIEENKYFFSESFYSYERGYKLCFGIVVDYLYFYLDLYLMRGDYDESLSWPCKCDVTIDIIKIDVINFKQTVAKKQIKYNNRKAHVGWNKPNKERNHYIEFHKWPRKNFDEFFENDQLTVKCKFDRAT